MGWMQLSSITLVLLLTGAPLKRHVYSSFQWSASCLFLECRLNSWTHCLSRTWPSDESVSHRKEQRTFLCICMQCLKRHDYTPQCNLHGLARGQRLILKHNHPHSWLFDCWWKPLSMYYVYVVTPAIKPVFKACFGPKTALLSHDVYTSRQSYFPECQTAFLFTDESCF